MKPEHKKLWYLPYRCGKGDGLVEALQFLHNSNEELLGQTLDRDACLVMRGRMEAVADLAKFTTKRLETERDKP